MFYKIIPINSNTTSFNRRQGNTKWKPSFFSIQSKPTKPRCHIFPSSFKIIMLYSSCLNITLYIKLNFLSMFSFQNFMVEIIHSIVRKFYHCSAPLKMVHVSQNFLIKNSRSRPQSSCWGWNNTVIALISWNRCHDFCWDRICPQDHAFRFFRLSFFSNNTGKFNKYGNHYRNKNENSN